MTEHALPALYALFVWWFSTGVILYLDGLPVRTFKWSMAGATLLTVLCLYGLWATASDATIAGAYLAFTFGLLAWGWQEISFYMGYVTGPRKQACPRHCGGLRHFWHGVEVTLWHELAIIGAFILIVVLTWGGVNHVGLWTFAVLWWMHESAKLNVFFGVRNLNLEFLPDHLDYVKPFLKKRSMNLLFPVSVTVSTIVCVVLFQRAFAPAATAFDAVGYTFLATLMALAILEHWFLVLPLPFAKLWQWGLRSRRNHDAGGPAEPGLETYSAELSAPVEAKPLAHLLSRIAAGAYGRIESIRGTVQCRDGWLRFDATRSDTRIAALTAAHTDQPRFTVIGQAIDRERLEAAFGTCHVQSAA